MAKKSMLAREKKRAATVKRYAAKRAEYRRIIRDPKSSEDARIAKRRLNFRHFLGTRVP